MGRCYLIQFRDVTVKFFSTKNFCIMKELRTLGTQSKLVRLSNETMFSSFTYPYSILKHGRSWMVHVVFRTV